MKTFNKNDSSTWIKCNRCGITTENIKRHQRENKKTCDSLREMYNGDCNRDSKLSAQKLNKKFSRRGL